MDVTFRPGTPNDLEAILELRLDCYPGNLDRAVLERRFRESSRFSLEKDLLVAERGGKLVASLVAMPLRAYAPLSSTPIPLCGIASVAVHPLIRRRGVAGNLVRRALEMARERGDALAGLFAFEYAFYARLGWAPVVRAQRFRCMPHNLPDYRERDHAVLLGPEAIPRLAACFEGLERASGRFCLARSQADWEALFRDESFRAYGAPGPDGRLEGYVLYEYKRLPEQPLQSTVQVQEFQAATPRAWRCLIGLLHCLQDQVRAVDIPGTSQDPLPLVWREQVQPESRMVRGEDYTVGEATVGMLLRWLNPAQCLTLRGYPALDAEFNLEVRDTGSWHFSLRGGQPAVSEAGDGPWVRADLGTWTQIWSGAVSATQAFWWGRLEVEESRLPQLDALFAAPPPFTHELDCY